MKPNDIFITGFADGLIRVYKYPVLFERAKFIEFRAHKGTVASVCLTVDNKHIISAGGDDSTIIVWRLTRCGNLDLQPLDRSNSTEMDEQT